MYNQLKQQIDCIGAADRTNVVDCQIKATISTSIYFTYIQSV